MDTIKNFYLNGIYFLEEQVAIRTHNREKSKHICKDLLYAHCLCCGIIKTLNDKFLSTVGKTSESVSTRLPLISSFIQGIDICEVCIIEGLYAQAAVIIKQELESVAAVNECVKNNRKNKKTPNVQLVKFGINKEYGFLNGIGHVSEKEIFEALYKPKNVNCPEYKQPVSLTPILDEELCERFYAIHILLIVQIIEQLICLYFDMYEYIPDEELKNSMECVYQILLKEEWLVTSEKNVVAR